MQSQGESIVDQFFHICLLRVLESSTNHLCFYGLRAVALLVTIPLNYLVLTPLQQQQQSLFHYFLLAAFIYNLVELFRALYFHCNQLTSKPRLLNIAAQLKHSLFIEELKQMHQEAVDEDYCRLEVNERTGFGVSTVFYDFENMERINDVAEEHRSMRQTAGMDSILAACEKDLSCYGCVSKLLGLASVGLVGFGVFVSFTTAISETQHSLLELVLISQVLFRPKVYALLLAISLVPFLLVFYCIYACFCKSTKKAKLPNSQRATAETIAKCSQCSICFQAYVVEQEITVLGCSDMHIFHTQCITGWSKVKPNCPICRCPTL